MWEKRYGLIMPERTSTNRRNYSSGQLIKLMNIATLLENGFKISALATLPEAEIARHIERLHGEGNNQSSALYINDLTAAMIGFNERDFEASFNAAVAELGFYDAMLQVFYPFLRKTGLLWRTEKVAPIQEHFASCLIRSKLIIAAGNIPLPPVKKGRIILFLPPGEWHEIGLLFANYLLRSRGYETVYFGQNVPYEELRFVTGSEHTSVSLLTFFVSSKPLAEIEDELHKLAEKYPGIKIFFSGDTRLFNGLKIKAKNLKFLNSVTDLASRFL